MYDSLLDELEDDVVSNPQEVEELTEKVVDAEEADAELLVEDGDTTVVPEGEIEAEVEAEVEAEGELAEGAAEEPEAVEAAEAEAQEEAAEEGEGS